ncbi:MAG: hypothetical protein ABJA76_09520 [Mucilaginibacter sp.]
MKFNISIADLTLLTKVVTDLSSLNPDACSQTACLQVNVKGSFISACVVPNDPNRALIYGDLANIEFE